MKKITKVMSAVLLLAVVVGAFGIFSAFADTSAVSTDAAASERVVVWDLDESGTGLTIANSGTYGNSTDSITKKTDELGQSYWQWKHDIDGSNNAYWQINFPNPYSNGNNAIIFADILNTTTNDAGIKTYATKDDGSYDVKYAKNTDYVVIDFDISTDSTFITDTFIQMRNYTGLSSSDYRQQKTTYPTLNMNNAGSADLRVGVSSEKTSAYSALYDQGEKWTNVTIVYDFSAEYDHATVDAGTAPAWVGYLYIDGYFITTISANFQQANAKSYTNSLAYPKALGYWRICSGTDGTNASGSTTNFANFTVSKFPVGYQGDLTEKLGDFNTPLFAMQDMQYCLENELDGDVKQCADIIRTVDGETKVIPIYDVDDLSGDLKDGDTVMVYRKLVADYVVVTEGNTVTWVDSTGTALASDSALMPKLLAVPADIDWAVIVNGAVKKTGVASDIYYLTANSSTTGRVAVDPLYGAIDGTKNTVVMFFGDVTSYGSGIKNATYTADDGTVTKNTTYSTKTVSASVKYDLNGNTLTINPAGSAHYLTGGENGKITIKNGNLIAKCSKNVYYSASSNGQLFTLENINMTTASGTFFDHRGGKFLVKDSYIDIGVTLDYAKEQRGRAGTTIIYNSYVRSAGGDGIMKISNVSGKYGSYNIALIIEDSEVINTQGELVRIEVTTNTDSDAAAALNDNYANVIIRNSKATAYSNTIQTSVISATDNTTDLWAKLIVIDSEINASSSVYMEVASSHVDKTWTLDVDVRYIGNTKVNCQDGGAAKGIINISGSTCKKANLYVYLDEGVISYDPLILRDPSTAPDDYTVVYANDAKWASTSLGGGVCKYILSNSTETYTYQYGMGPVSTVEWNKPTDGTEDPVDIYAIAPLASKEGVYTYEWVLNGNAYNTKLVVNPEYKPAAKATLSLSENFVLNVYLPDDADLTYAARDIYGQAVGGYKTAIDGTGYTRFSSRGITPTHTEDTALTVDLTVYGAYGDSAQLSVDYSVLDYLTAYDSDNGAAADSALVNAIINYIYSAYVYAHIDTAALEAIKPAGAYEMNTDAALIETLPGVKISVNYGESLAWGIKAPEGTPLTVNYYSYVGGADAVLVEKSIVMPEEGIVYVPMMAYDFLNALTVTKGGVSASVNLAGYYSRLAQDDAKDMVAAIYNYAVAAYSFASSNPAAPSDANSGTLSADGKTVTYSDKVFANVGAGFGTAENVVFENCIFVISSADAASFAFDGSAKSYVFDGCTFVTDAANAGGKYALVLAGGAGAPDYTVKNCQFSSPKGILITAEEGAAAYGDIVIEGNSFAPYDAASPVAIEIAGIITADAINVRNNVFEFGTTILAEDSVAALISFKGNTLPYSFD